MRVQIKFIASGSSSLTGNFAPGDTLRCSLEHAKHLVEDAQCADYVDKPGEEPKAAPESKATSAPAAKPGRKPKAAPENKGD